MSIKLIHELTGFSYSTISRVINGKSKDYRISEDTQKAILEAAAKINYRPNILARSLRLKKTLTIGLIVSDIQNPFFGELGSRIEKDLRVQGYSTILCNANEVPANEEFYLKILVDRHVDGIIISPIQTEEWRFLENIGKKTPVVLMDRIFFHTELPWVTSENARAAELMTETMIALGHKSIAYLGGTPDSYINAVRFKGFRNAFENHGIQPNPDILLSVGYSVKAGEDMMTTALEKDPNLRAVFCVNNLVFLGAMKVIQQNEMNGGPGKLVGAFDIKPYCNIFKRPIICANQDLETIGKTAVSLMMDRINDRPRDKNHIIVPIHVQTHRLNMHEKGE
jgi:LacI family transcriptional regulator